MQHCHISKLVIPFFILATVNTNIVSSPSGDEAFVAMIDLMGVISTMINEMSMCSYSNLIRCIFFHMKQKTYRV